MVKREREDELILYLRVMADEIDAAVFRKQFEKAAEFAMLRNEAMAMILRRGKGIACYSTINQLKKIFKKDVYVLKMLPKEIPGGTRTNSLRSV